MADDIPFYKMVMGHRFYELKDPDDHLLNDGRFGECEFDEETLEEEIV